MENNSPLDIIAMKTHFTEEDIKIASASLGGCSVSAPSLLRDCSASTPYQVRTKSVPPPIACIGGGRGMAGRNYWFEREMEHGSMRQVA